VVEAVGRAVTSFAVGDRYVETGQKIGNVVISVEHSP
jgi:hypothetical protein